MKLKILYAKVLRPCYLKMLEPGFSAQILSIIACQVNASPIQKRQVCLKLGALPHRASRPLPQLDALRGSIEQHPINRRLQV